MRTVFLSVMILFMAAAANAQSSSATGSDYRTALGVKVWDGGGVSLKHFFTDKHAGELIAYFWGHGVRFTGLYEIHGGYQQRYRPEMVYRTRCSYRRV